ncbi:MAG: ABC transporter permease [Clostridiales Family XIII bacterium]|jgi:simple sugar transport system permease protein|nr:ABC transporter permease [Clostridiales Family XIII bacterium]
MTANRWLRLLTHPLMAAVLSVAIGLAFGAIIIALAGYSPAEAYAALLRGIFARPRYVVNVVLKSTPIILTGLSVAFAFKTGIFNIGAEGQYIAGAVTAGILGYVLDIPAAVHIPLVIVAAVCMGAVWGGIAGVLKARFGIHEVISTIMLNWIALYLQNFLVKQPWLKKPNAESSYEVLENARVTVLGEWKFTDAGYAWAEQHPKLADILLKTDLSVGFLIAVAVVILIWYILNRTTLGYSLRAVGYGADAAEAAGISVKQNTVVAMCIAGGLAGLAGALNVLGANPFRISILSLMEGYGFDGLSVALVAGSSPVGCIFSGLLLTGLRYGGNTIQSELGVPSEVISIVIGVIVFAIAISTVFSIIARILMKKREGSL